MSGPVIDVALVRRLVGEQFPQWAGLPARPVAVSGVDNRTFRLGAELTVRLPSAVEYSGQAPKEQRWLPWLGPQLPLPVPEPVGHGAPAQGYPFAWSVCRWLVGETAGVERIADLQGFAVALAEFLTALYSLDAAGGPTPGQHSYFRGGPLTTYDAETWQAIDALGPAIDRAAVTRVWETALAARWSGPPVWFHGDVAAANLLVRDGRLAAVIDFGCCGVGDPACDLAIAWTLFSGASRDAFRTALPLDPATWARGRGWALWKALITMVPHPDQQLADARAARHVLDEVLADFACGDRV